MTKSKDDISETEARMDRTRERYLARLLRGDTTRATTTTYNAEMGRLAQRRDQLRAEPSGSAPRS